MNSLPRAFIAVARPVLGLGGDGWATAEAASERAVKTSEKRILRLLSKRELLMRVHNGRPRNPLYIKPSSGYTGKLARGRGLGLWGDDLGRFPIFDPCTCSGKNI